jgi:hypothetical protein
MVDEIGIVKGLRHSGVKEGFAHVTAVAGRALARQGRKDRGERYDNVPNVVMFWDPWKVGGSLTFRQCAKCRNEMGDPANVLGVL